MEPGHALLIFFGLLILWMLIPTRKKKTKIIDFASVPDKEILKSLKVVSKSDIARLSPEERVAYAKACNRAVKNAERNRNKNAERILKYLKDKENGIDKHPSEYGIKMSSEKE